jgi:predicted MPP superfamily phosphohydrolase
MFRLMIPSKYRKALREKARGIAADVAFRYGGSPRFRAHSVRMMKALSGGVGYATLIEPRLIEITQLEIPVRNLPMALDGYRIAHVTDIHYNIAAGAGFLERVVARTNALDPDIVALTGDFIGHNPENLHRCMALLSDLRAPDGLWATRGNHDHNTSYEHFVRECRDAHIHFLENRHVVLKPSRCRIPGIAFPHHHEICSPIVLAGVGDLWEGVCSPGQALEGADSSLPTILLSHNPQAAELLVDGQRADLVLSGHTHGGQIRVLGRTFKAFSDGSLKYVSGLVETPRTRVYISRGVGTSAFRLRWNCRPEIALIRLVRDESPPGEHTSIGKVDISIAEL